MDVTLLTSRCGRTTFALATTLAAGSLTFVACTTPDRVSGQASDEEPAKVATAMGTQGGESSSSVAESAIIQKTASRETTLTARAFMDYLDEQQRGQILGDGLILNDLTQAQQITMLKVLETLLNDSTHHTVSSLLEHITTAPDAEPHHLRFSALPTMEKQWKLDLDGPMFGLHAVFTEDGHIDFEAAHFTLDDEEIHAITSAAEAGAGEAAISTAHGSTMDLLGSLTDQQRLALSNPTASGGGGLKGSELTDYQKQMLIDATASWICLGDEATVTSKQEKIADTLDETYFSVLNDPDGNRLAFRVDGPEVFIEFTEQHSENGDTSFQSVFEDPSLRDSP